ncbi:MAG: hypothetical protein DMG42_36225 [Acidobacteria bacterium]|nr:MAG: hypothetical protein DMG42_36225 [Acidobacteriota bacterium]
MAKQPGKATAYYHHLLYVCTNCNSNRVELAHAQEYLSTFAAQNSSYKGVEYSRPQIEVTSFATATRWRRIGPNKNLVGSSFFRLTDVHVR